MGNLLRRRSLMVVASGTAPDVPLYTLTNGSRKAYNSGTATGNNGDVKVTNGNHFYYLKRWGSNSALYFAPLTTGNAPFSVSAGDVVRTVVNFDLSKTTGAGLKILFGKYSGDSASLGRYNSILITANPSSGATAENVVTLTQSYAPSEFFILAQTVSDTSGKAWEADLEIYVNGVRYI